MKVPSPVTLRKYGLTKADWPGLWLRAQGCCQVCSKPLCQGKFYIDHEHVRGYKKLKSWVKPRHVRGLLCYRCNRFKVASNTLDSARQVLHYLEQHEAREHG